MHDVERQLPIVDTRHIHAEWFFRLTIKLSREHGSLTKYDCSTLAKLKGRPLAITASRLRVAVGGYDSDVAA